MPLVGSHQQGAFSTPTNGQPTDASVVLSNDNANRTTTNAHDADATIHIQSSVLASRPAAGTAQRVWITTDGLRAYVDSGSVWNELDYLSKTAGGTVAGAVTLSASLTAAAASFSGAVTMSATLSVPTIQGTAATLTVIGGASGTTLANNANNAANLALTDAGAATFRNTVTISAGGLTVSSGTTAVQALTATTVTAGVLTTTDDGGQKITVGRYNAGFPYSYFIPSATSSGFKWQSPGSVDLMTLSNAGALSVNSITVVTGGVTISAGGLAVTGGITGTLSTAAQPNITSVGVLASPHLTSPVVDSGGLTVTAGGLTVTAGDVIASGGIVKASAHGMFGANNGSGDAGSLCVSNDTASSATAGAQSLPAAPVGFLVWKKGATTIKVPYYNA